MKYVLVDEKKRTGHGGVRLTNENVNSFSDRLKKIWLGAGIIKEAKEKLTKTEK